MTTANVPNFKLTGDPAIDGLILKGIVLGATFAVTSAANHLKIADPEFITYLTTIVISLLITAATFIYGYVLSRVSQAKAVQAGVNLTVSGAALANDGKTIISQNDGGTPPQPVTMATATQIVKAFGAPK